MYESIMSKEACEQISTDFFLSWMKVVENNDAKILATIIWKLV